MKRIKINQSIAHGGLRRKLLWFWSLTLVLILLAGCNVAQPPVVERASTHAITMDRSMNGHEGSAEFETESDENDEPHPDHPGEAALYRLEQLQNEFGRIPPNAYTRALEHIRKMREHEASMLSATGSGINNNSWNWLGPGNVGGRVRSIVIHPTQTDTMWIGSVSGGIWRTDDGGDSWSPVDDFMANLAIATMIMDPSNSNIMYAGTGEGFYNFDALRGEGIFKSTDGGVTWNQLASTNNSNFYWVNRLAITSDGAVLLAGTRNHGIFRSTDGGTSWTQTLNDNIADIDFDPSDNNKAIAGGLWNGDTWYSTDGGQTWHTATFNTPGIAGAGRVEVAYAPSNSNIVYASVNVNKGELWKSTDGGQTYSRVNTGNELLSSQGWYDNIIWIDPTDPNYLIVGGVTLWRSSDGGTTVTQIQGNIHVDHHAIVSHPNFDGDNNKTVVFGNDGGVYKTDDVYAAAIDFQDLNNNLGITQFYGGAGNKESGVVYGGAQDNGTLRYAGDPQEWMQSFGGDGGWCAADPTDPNYLYGEYVYLRIHRSTDGGINASYIFNGITDAGNCARFIAPFILDPNNANTMLAGGCSLWRSTNVKATTPSWTSIKGQVATNDPPEITAVAAAEGNSDIIWVGYDDGRIEKTTNGTAASPTWTRMDENTPNLPNRQVLRITIDPDDPDTVYAAFGGFSPDNLWRTTDGGMNWTDITGSGVTGLPDAPVRDLDINPDDSDILYTATEVGLFTSTDGGATWNVPHDGPANVSVDETFWMGDSLMAVTHGRGIYQSIPLSLNIAKTAAPSPVTAGETLTYTLTVENRTNTTQTHVTISDTIPADTTYVANSSSCGGSVSNGVLTIPLGDISPEATRSCTFRVIVSNSLTGPAIYLEDDMESGDGNWTTSAGQGSYNWSLTTDNAHSPTHVWFAQDPSEVSDQYLTLTNPISLSANAPSQLSFWHDYDMEQGYDGGVIEISTDGGTTWEDLGPQISENGYNGSISENTSPLKGREVFTGNSGGYKQTVVDLAPYAGQSILIRFRLASDASAGKTGWYVDDVVIEKPTADKVSNTASVHSDEGKTSDATVETPVNSCFAPNAVTDQSASKVNATTIRLVWSAVTDAAKYQVWDALNDPYFDPTDHDCANPAPYACTEVTATSYQDSNALGDAVKNHYYNILPVSSCGSAATTPSNRTGEFDFTLTPGAP